MTAELTGRRVAFLATNGVEQIELTAPWQAVEQADGTPVLISVGQDAVTAMNGDWDRGETFDVAQQADEARAADFDALVLPGGTLNADTLRADEDVLALLRAFFDAGQPVAAICHAPWLLINAGLAQGRRLTSVGNIALDLKNAGADWVDEAVVVDGNLTTSRTPADIEEFSAAVVRAVADAPGR